MKLLFWDYAPNFGDQLNLWLWPKLLPGLLDDDASHVLYGIGTILHLKRPAETRRVSVFGSGVGYSDLPKVDDAWKFYCVRGPLTAKALGLSPDQAVTDPGALVRAFRSGDRPVKKHRFSFVPHWGSARAGQEAWKRVCEAIGFAYIDPFWPVEKVMTAIEESEVLVAEAMHGAILADALRVPWIPVATSPDILEFKWQDWCATLGVSLRMERAITPELRVRKSSRNAAMYDAWNGKGVVGAMRLRSAASSMKHQLAAIANSAAPHLSAEAVLDARIAELLERRDRLRADILSERATGR